MENWLQEEMHRLIDGKFEHFPSQVMPYTTASRISLEQFNRLADYPKVAIRIQFTENGLRFFKLMIKITQSCEHVPIYAIAIEAIEGNEILEDNEIMVIYNDGSAKIEKWCDHKELDKFIQGRLVKCY